MKNITKEMKIAYHEAGHAVLLVLFGVEFKAVTIETSGGNRPRVIAKKNEMIDRIDDCCVRMAGKIAENKLQNKKYYFPKREIPVNEKEFIDIFSEPYLNDCEELIISSSTIIGLKEIKSFTNWIIDRTRNYFEIKTSKGYKNTAVWSAVELLAENLLKKKTLTYEEVLEILD